MEILFANSLVPIYFFILLTVHNGFDDKLNEPQKISIMYIILFFLEFFNRIGFFKSCFLLIITMICFLEILTDDETKLNILINPIYKIIDCFYLSVFQYGIVYAFISLSSFYLFNKHLLINDNISKIVGTIIGIVFLSLSITQCLRQKYIIRSFDDMFYIFKTYPINTVEFNGKLKEAAKILVSIEDRKYYERKGYTILSIDNIEDEIRKRIGGGSILSKIKRGIKLGNRIYGHISLQDRGFSTIPMQLVRSLGIKKGYSYTYRRKIYEFLYSKMFFDGLRDYYKTYKYENMSNFKDYLIYIYFHTVNTFLGTTWYPHFLEAFEDNASNSDSKDIYECSNEGIFIACMGLSKSVVRINQEKIDYLLSNIQGVDLDRNKILQMLENYKLNHYLE